MMSIRQEVKEVREALESFVTERCPESKESIKFIDT